MWRGQWRSRRAPLMAGWAVAPQHSLSRGIAGRHILRVDGALGRLVYWGVVVGEFPGVAVVVGELPEVAQAVGAVAVVGDEVVLDIGLGLGLGLVLDLGRAPEYGPRYKDGIQR